MVNLALELVHVLVRRDVRLGRVSITRLKPNHTQTYLSSHAYTRNEPPRPRLGPIFTLHQPLPPLFIERGTIHSLVEVDMTVDVELLVKIVKVLAQLRSARIAFLEREILPDLFFEELIDGCV